MTTLTTLINHRTDQIAADLRDLLDAGVMTDDLVPVAEKITAQGDILARRTTRTNTCSDPIPVDGVAVVAGTHDHVVCGVGTWTRINDRTRVVAIIECQEPVWLLHAEHGGQGLAPGRWEILHQTETTAAGQRRVAD